MTDIITDADKLAAAKRELHMRKTVYPRWVEQGRISAGKAVHETACMEAIVKDYEIIVANMNRYWDEPASLSTTSNAGDWE